MTDTREPLYETYADIIEITENAYEDIGLQYEELKDKMKVVDELIVLLSQPAPKTSQKCFDIGYVLGTIDQNFRYIESALANLNDVLDDSCKALPLDGLAMVTALWTEVAHIELKMARNCFDEVNTLYEELSSDEDRPDDLSPTRTLH